MTGLAHDHKPGTPCTIRCPVWWWVTIDRFTRERPRRQEKGETR